MRGGNSLKNYILAGLIAGFASGIVRLIFMISGLWELFSVHPLIFYRTRTSIPFDIQTLTIFSILEGIIYGIILSVFFALFYNYIPGEGVKKGLVFGLIMWLFIGLRPAILNAIALYHQYAIPQALSHLFGLGITYGLLIGILYKKE